MQHVMQKMIFKMQSKSSCRKKMQKKEMINAQKMQIRNAKQIEIKNKIEITNKILDPPTLAAQGEARKGKGVSDTADVRN